MILVSGASGAIGSRLVGRLVAVGQQPTVTGRRPERLHQRWPDLRAVELDALRPQTLERALRGIDVGYYLIHSMGEGERGFEERDRQAAENFARAAREAGVARVVYLGGLGRRDQELSPHLASRQETGRALAANGPPVVELRAAIVVAPESASFRMLTDLVRRLPVMVVPRWVETRSQPIAVADVLEYLVASADVRTDEHHTIVEIGAETPVSYREMLDTYARLTGRRRSLLGVPFLTPRLSSLWCAFTTSVPLSVARPLIDGLTAEMLVTDDAATKLFPDIRPVPFEEALRRAMEEEAEL